MKSNHIARMKIVLCALFSLVGVSAQADDTDLFASVPPGSNNPRVMLLVDTSNSMKADIGQASWGSTFTGCSQGASSYSSKLCILKRELKKFLVLTAGFESLYWPDSMEVGLAQYAPPGGIILAPIDVLGDGSAGTQRAKLISLVDDLKPGNHVLNGTTTSLVGTTPLVGSYLEIAEYMTGGKPVSQASKDLSESSIWSDSSLKDQYAGLTPGDGCGGPNNHIVVLTDGESTCDVMDNGANYGHLNCGDVGQTLTSSLGQRINVFADPAATAGSYPAACGSLVATDREIGGTFWANTFSNENIWGCLDVIADALVQNSAAPVAPNVSEKIRTHVIAYDLAGSSILGDLQAWATKGEGTFANAQSGSDLSNALKSAFDAALLGGAYTVSAGGVGINQLNSFTYLNEIYFSAVTPSNQPFWYGNLKKYKLKLDANGDLGIYGKTQLAVKDGEFLPNVDSVWSDVVSANYGTSAAITKDGNIAHIGGAASIIDDSTRKRRLVAYFEGNQLNAPVVKNVIERRTVSGSSTTEEGSLKALMAADIGAPTTTAYSTKLDSMLRWLMGQDVLDEWVTLSGDTQDQRPAPKGGVRDFWGAPLHSSPRIVNYKSSSTPVENLLFVSSNDGKLYAIDSSDGVEKVAYMPSAMLERDVNGGPSKVEQMYDAIASGVNGPAIYGLDSSWTVWREDRNDDGDITSGGGSTDFVYLYGGMRRGGRNYYVLDATLANSGDISELAVIKGGEPGSRFEHNGQTWSEPKLAFVKVPDTVGTKAAAVFVVGGGYDVGYDAGRPVSSPAAGAQLHVVAAYPFTACGTSYGVGDVVWWASSASSTDARHVQISDMTYSIPSTVKTFDIDGNGYLDHIYVGDMGGQIMRFDLDATPSCSGAEVDLMENANASAQNVLVAQLGVAGHVANSTDYGLDRRFFYPPSVAIMRGNTGMYVGIAVGSGWRSNPLDESVDEKMYFLKDYQPFSNTPQSVISEGAVTQSQNAVIQPLSVVTTPNALPKISSTLLSDSEIKGFSVELGLTAEKLLGSPLIIDNKLYFSTYYRDSTQASNTCTPSTGFSAFYVIDLGFPEGEAGALMLGGGLPQNAAGSVQAIVIIPDPPPPPTGQPQQPSSSPGPMGILISGTKAIGSANLNLNDIHKTRWYQEH